MNLEALTQTLDYREGIYYSKENKPLSYPEEGNDICYQLEENSFWFRHRNNCIKELVKSFHVEDEAFFDVGGGNGFVAKGLQDIDIQSVLLEPGINGVQNAKKRGVDTVICSTIEDLKLSQPSMPSVGLFDVIEHIEDDHGFLNTIHKNLGPSGKVFITVPAYKFLWATDDLAAGHYRRYTLDSLHKTLESCSFRVVYSSYLFSFLPLPIFIFRSIPSKLNMRKDPKNIKDLEKQHNTNAGEPNKILERCLSWELNRIAHLRKIPFGSSCICVAEKV